MDVKAIEMETQRRVLWESVDLENRADLNVAAGSLSEGLEQMQAANKLRASVFGKLDPNELRRRTHEALAVQGHPHAASQ